MCEPIFDRPLKEISLGKVLVQLFQTSRRFNVEIQPQLVLLQKTLLNVEGLGRQLDPDLDLWVTAKPFLERWMEDQIGWRGLVEHAANEAPCLGQHAAAAAAPAAPRARRGPPRRRCAIAWIAWRPSSTRRNDLLLALLVAVLAAVVLVLLRRSDTSAAPDFWKTRYRGGVTPWDAGRVPPRLRGWLATLPAANAGARPRLRLGL